MATYAEIANQRELREKRRVQDRHMAALHRNFDLSAQDNHMKYERPQFAVVTASEAFRAGWDAIFSKTTGGASKPELNSSEQTDAPESQTGA